MTVAEIARPVSPGRRLSGCLDDTLSFNRRALFVGGCPKSGTTLLLSLLDGHPELAVFPRETHFLEEAAKHRALGADYPAKLRRLLARLDPRRHDGLRFEGNHPAGGFEAGRCDQSDFARFSKLADEYVRQPGMNDSLVLSETVRAYMATVGCDWRSCVHWVEKTPTNIAHIDDLFRLFPDAKVIQIMRDPRAVFASRRRRLINEYGAYTKAHRLVREWNQSARQLKRWKSRSGSHLVVHYEDLVRESGTVLEKICRFAGIEFIPEMLEPTLAGQPWPGNPTFCGAFDRIDTRPVNQWKSELTADEIWWIELHCREGMQIAGYELETDASFSFPHWAARLPGESWRGYLRARKSSLCQMAGLLTDCRYELPALRDNPPVVTAEALNVPARRS